jgi:hypothetical protein
MKVLVVGSKGSMGRRYCAILRYLQEDVLEADLGDMWWEWEFDRIIIATPTDRHETDLRAAVLKGKPILCEKPIVKSAAELETLWEDLMPALVDIRMVCNWKYAINLAMVRANGNKGKVAVAGEMEIEYNYYDSGKDGFFWDCIQLIHLAGTFKYDRTRPAFQCLVNGEAITLEHIHESYVMMVSEWLNGDKAQLWSLEEALTATRKVEVAMRLDPSPKIGPIVFTGEQ